MMTVALVTGAGGALGRAIAKRLSDDGFRVVVTDVDTEELERTAVTVAPAAAEVVDLRDASAIQELFSTVSDRFGGIGVLVNNAAIYPSRAFLDIPLSEYDDVQAVNQRGYWVAAQCAARQMVAAGGGAIVNLASITMHGGWTDLASYVATKGAAVAMTRALARELGPHGIRVNAVSPGAFPTAAELIHDNPASYDEFVLSRQALKRRGTPEELASVISFLVGTDSSFVTGQTIEVNGGWVMT
jgi:NAD(P)-dependent dehydrogenase (short-subunit alcohol dehydrogenase family)